MLDELVAEVSTVSRRVGALRASGLDVSDMAIIVRAGELGAGVGAAEGDARGPAGACGAC